MNRSTRPASQRLTAAGFIVMTLAGNFWLVFLLMGKKTPALVVHSFEIGMFMVILGGLGMAVDAIRAKYGRSAHQTEIGDSAESSDTEDSSQ